MNSINENILTTVGNQHSKFSLCTKFLSLNRPLNDFAERVQGPIDPEKIEKIYLIMQRKFSVEEWEFIHMNSEAALEKFQHLKRCHDDIAGYLNNEAIDSFEMLESILISKNLKKKGVVSGFSMPFNIKKFVYWGYSQNQIFELLQNNLAGYVLSHKIFRLCTFNLESLRSASQNDIRDNIYHFLFFHEKLNLKNLYSQFSYHEVSQWENYVVRGFEWEKEYRCSQKKYGSFMYRATLIGADGIKKKWSFIQNLTVLAEIRKHIAQKLGHSYAWCYGQIRNKVLITKLEKPYDRVNSMLEQLAEKGITAYLSFPKKSDNEVRPISTFGKISNKIIPLSQKFFGEVDFQDYKKLNFLIHTHYKFTSLIMDHVETLYEESLQINNTEKLHCKLGEIFWWICKAKPWNRGDPSIAELLIKSIYRFHEIEPPAWKTGIIPWVAVECEPDVDQFANNFKNLLEFYRMKSVCKNSLTTVGSQYSKFSGWLY